MEDARVSLGSNLVRGRAHQGPVVLVGPSVKKFQKIIYRLDGNFSFA